MLHSCELPAILARGARLLMISDEHPDALERLVPEPALEGRVKAAVRLAKASSLMRVTSVAGTDLSVDLTEAQVAGVWGWCDRPGSVAHWPGGLVAAFPKAASVEGTLVLDRGDINLTFKRYLERPVSLRSSATT
jgi:2,5-dihydroxypyridine 5,6-dioxygenase